MAYNIHPIFVHFPIALLFIYSIIMVLPVEKWFPRVAWRDIARALLALGVLGAFAALATGDTAKHLVHPDRALVNAHSNFAVIATVFYCMLLLGEICAFVNARFPDFMAKTGVISEISKAIEKILCNKVVAALIALLALVALSVAGLLGGVLVYGTSADPLAGFVLKILGL
ncbi:MAG TPA: DUF2231 domain-containing protein [Candidatus Paceibacterota bacterium]|nr:DUF2231 domain-containing protein [Candidatus Paceibacterota bacterium]